MTAGKDAQATQRLLMGNQAIGLAAIAAGVNVACGYPGTPSTEIVETIAANNPDKAIHVEWSTNEKAALELAAGASYAGARVIMTCKQVGLNVAADPLMSLAYVGTVGGLVVVAADDPGPISSQTEQDTRQFAQFAHVPVLDPASPEEAWDMTQAAFELSERYGCPVILRPTTRVDHACASIEVPADLAAIPRHAIGGFDKDPRFVIFPPLSRRAHGRMAADLSRMGEEFCTSPFNRLEVVRVDVPAPAAEAGMGGEPALAAEVGPGGEPVPAAALETDDDVYLGIACGGDSRGYVREALAKLADAARDQGVELPAVRLLQVGTPFPFPDGLGRAFLSGLADVLAVEELEPVIERSLTSLTGPMTVESHPLMCPPAIHGRLDGTTPMAGEYGSDLLLPILADFLGMPGRAAGTGGLAGGEAGDAPEDALVGAAPSAPEDPTTPPADLVPPRPPVLCAGCPHRASFLIMKEAAGGRPCVFSGDIGCYTLGCNRPLDATDTCLCMGAGVTIAQGLQTAAHLAGDDQTLHVGFVGDSTFFASAMTGIANAVYNGHRMCLCVLDNATTAMTGSQPHPGTGVTLMGTRREPISIPEVCRALGCDLVEVVDPLDRSAALAAAEAALDCPGVSVVVFRSPCVQLFRALPAVEVDGGACVGCGACVRRTGCPALSIGAPASGDGGPTGGGGGPASGDGGSTGSHGARPHARVDASQCTGCDLCLAYCRFGAIKTPRAGTTAQERDAMRREAGRG